jgi:23S rRNA pseudouridine1911/1915/1917 synthase
VNEKPVKSNYKIKPGDEVKILLPNPEETWELLPEDIPLDIIYEDEHLMVINKQPGLTCHPALGHKRGTLVNACLFHFGKSAKLSDDYRPGIVHRLDKDTSGVMVVAKTDYSLMHLAKQFFDRTTQRSYIALVWGDFAEETGRIEGYIGRNIRDRKQMDVFDNEEQGKFAVTHFKVLERFGYVTLVECKLETGRTHQIRVHFKHIGHPLFCDELYGGRKILKGTTFSKYKQFIENNFELLNRQALHAKSLGFVHPVTGENMFFDSDLAPDMLKVLDKWRTYSNFKDTFTD